MSIPLEPPTEVGRTLVNPDSILFLSKWPLPLPKWREPEQLLTVGKDSITFFSNGVQVGVLHLDSPVRFEGDCDESAKAFWTAIERMRPATL